MSLSQPETKTQILGVLPGLVNSTHPCRHEQRKNDYGFFEIDCRPFEPLRECRIRHREKLHKRVLTNSGGGILFGRWGFCNKIRHNIRKETISHRYAEDGGTVGSTMVGLRREDGRTMWVILRHSHRQPSKLELYLSHYTWKTSYTRITFAASRCRPGLRADPFKMWAY